MAEPAEGALNPALGCLLCPGRTNSDNSLTFRLSRLTVLRHQVTFAVAPHAARRAVDAQAAPLGLQTGKTLRDPARPLQHSYHAWSRVGQANSELLKFSEPSVQSTGASLEVSLGIPVSHCTANLADSGNAVRTVRVCS